MPHHRQSKLATAKEAAQYLRRSPTTLERWRREGVGPEYIGGGGHGRCVFYRWSDLDAYIASQVRKTADSNTHGANA